MRRREAWMKVGAKVTACGDPGVITKIMGSCTINGTEYIYNIRVLLKDEKKSRVFHPADVHKLELTDII